MPPPLAGPTWSCFSVLGHVSDLSHEFEAGLSLVLYWETEEWLSSFTSLNLILPIMLMGSTLYFRV
jgi:hypothetical protein